MITFDDVRIEEDKTYTFMPFVILHDFMILLRENQIPCKRGKFRDVRDGKIPEIKKIPESEMDRQMQRFEKTGENLQLREVLISDRNVDDLFDKAIAMWEERGAHEEEGLEEKESGYRIDTACEEELRFYQLLMGHKV